MSAAAPAPAGDVTTERPAETVELCELLYRQIFSAGLLVAVCMTAYAAFLSVLRPEDRWFRGFVVSLVLLVPAGAALRLRAGCYRFLRRHPAGIVIPAALAGGGAWAIGQSNEQMLYVVTLTLGVCGLTVSFPYMFGGACLAGLGIGMPALLSSTPRIDSTAIVSITIPVIFWLIIEQIARYILRAYGQSPDAARRTRTAAPDDPTGGDPTAARSPLRRLAGRLQRLLLPRTSAARRAAVALSARQTEIVLLRAEGLSHDEIGACLDIGAQQVRRLLREARSRTGAATTPALMAWAIRNGVLAPGHRATQPDKTAV